MDKEILTHGTVIRRYRNGMENSKGNDPYCYLKNGHWWPTKKELNTSYIVNGMSSYSKSKLDIFGLDYSIVKTSLEGKDENDKFGLYFLQIQDLIIHYSNVEFFHEIDFKDKLTTRGLAHVLLVVEGFKDMSPKMQREVWKPIRNSILGLADPTLNEDFNCVFDSPICITHN